MRPTLVVLHGGGRAAKHYEAFAKVLPRFEVVLHDRVTASLDEVVEAIKNAQFVFGHSLGTLYALEAARRVKIEKLALYDAPVVMLLPPFVWKVCAELDAGHEARGMALLAKHLGYQVPTWLPAALLALPIRLSLDKTEAQLLHRLPRELEAMKASDPRTYSEITCPTLVMVGEKSPSWMHTCGDVIASAVPKGQMKTVEGLGHNGPDLEAPEKVAALLDAFFIG